MPVPIICLDGQLRQFAERFREQFSKPQFKYFVIVLLGLLLCEGARTLVGLLRQVADAPSLSGLSRFLAQASWDEAAVVEQWLKHFRQQMQVQVQAEQQRQRLAQPKRRGRPKQPVVTGYLIGDDSTIQNRKGQKLQGLGKHYSSTQGKPVVGHSLVQALYVLLGRRCPLAPQMYRQQRVCEQQGVPFRSKIELMVEYIRTFEPVTGALTHVLVDSWYSAKAVWRAARERGFHITTGLKCNRSLRVEDRTGPQGWRWQHLTDYVAGLPAEAYRLITWPSQTMSRQVYVHVIGTRIRKLYCCQLVIVREALSAPLSEVRYFASSDLEANVDLLLGHITARWDIEVLFGDTKDLLGLDQYQLLSATAILRFWTLVMAAYTFLDEVRARLGQTEPRPATIGQARREVHRMHRRHLLHWLREQFLVGKTLEAVCDQLAA